ncbi:hypothetical protein Pcinc_006282 [Petrolisthes cinctipes]|uniref:Integrase catalytic domain-containing protein n=1 Tax=Petrolisthes cinctipes TaxID=88211 RepID=A0AAE1KY56_PETCI|nr:hypothetical protein Pcinc_006282 [Petrolisthes cinctipes]
MGKERVVGKVDGMVWEGNGTVYKPRGASEVFTTHMTTASSTMTPIALVFLLLATYTSAQGWHLSWFVGVTDEVQDDLWVWIDGRVADLQDKFQDVFDHTTVGDLGATHHIKLKPEVHPVVHAQRRVQEPIREKVRAHLDELVEQEVIAPVNEATDWFGRHGVPLTVVADSGTQFRSAEFTRFAREWNFEVVVSSPYYHQSNGKAENGVKTVKRMLQKCYLDNKDPMLAILEWRNTPSEQTGFSPAQRMFARRCRTPLPVSQELLLPEVDREGLAYDKHQQARKIQAAYYNCAIKPLPPLSTGNQVALQVPGSTSWVPGTVVRSLPHRAYEVESGSWRYKRNRRHLRPTLVPPATPPASRRPSCLRPRRLSFDTGSMGEAIDQHNCSGEPVTSPQTKSVPQYLPPPTPPLRRSSHKSKPPERYTAC